MALQSKYQQFLARPSLDVCAPGAALHYIPTTVTITEPAAIIKHLNAQEHQLKKKENFLNVIEGPTSICAETETTISFAGGGGTFLPGLDDNFLADRTVTIPVMHIVAFDKEQKIQQIRLMWDQGSLLKSVDVIGARGKNWPIRDGKDQIKTLNTSIEDTVTGVMNGVSLSDARQARRGSKGGANSQTNINLFAPRNFDREDSPANPVAPRASARPPHRDPTELFTEAPTDRSMSPSKRNPTKLGAGKNFHENRLFDDTPLDPNDPMSPERRRKANPKQYEHFEFGEKDLDVKSENRRSKHMNQWNFEDFETPVKPKMRENPSYKTDINWMEDEPTQGGHARHQSKAKPRPDAEPHFSMKDDSTPRPAATERVRPKQDRGGLYEDHVNLGDFSKNSSAATAGPATSEEMPLGNITNATKSNAQGHKKNFSSHFDMTDEQSKGGSEIKSRNLPEPLKKVAKMNEATWSMHDDNTPPPKHKGINIAGDGMGGKKSNTEKPWWEFGD